MAATATPLPTCHADGLDDALALVDRLPCHS